MPEGKGGSSWKIVKDPEARRIKANPPFTISSDLYDYGPLKFKTIQESVSYGSSKGFDFQVYNNGELCAYWSSTSGLTKLGD